MRLVEFLISLLEAHAQTLHRLAALFGDELLMHMLEESGEKMEAFAPRPALLPSDLKPSSGGRGFSSPYSALEGAVHEFKLPAVLEFHLWAYPPYRAWIEGDYELDSQLPTANSELMHALVETTIEQAQAWVKLLPIAPEYAPRAQTAANVPWLKLRARTLKRLGKRPLGPVS